MKKEEEYWMGERQGNNGNNNIYMGQDPQPQPQSTSINPLNPHNYPLTSTTNNSQLYRMNPNELHNYYINNQQRIQRNQLLRGGHIGGQQSAGGVLRAGNDLLALINTQLPNNLIPTQNIPNPQLPPSDATLYDLDDPIPLDPDIAREKLLNQLYISQLEGGGMHQGVTFPPFDAGFGGGGGGGRRGPLIEGTGMMGLGGRGGGPNMGRGGQLPHGAGVGAHSGVTQVYIYIYIYI